MGLVRSAACILGMAAASCASNGSAKASDHQQPQQPQQLTHVASVRKLPLRQAAQAVPVHLQGVVTALSGYKNSFFVQDGTAGISVDRTDHASVRVDDRVEIIGVSNSGMFAPVVMASKVVVLGRGAKPVARRVTYGDLIGGGQDSQWVELKGVVHEARIGPLFETKALYLVLDVGAATVNLIVRDFEAVDADRLIDATIRVRGVCSTSFNKKRQFVSAALFVTSLADVTVEHAASGGPFSGPLLPISDALRFGQAQHRVRMAGVVTWQVPGKLLYIQNGEAGLRVETSSPIQAPTGTKVEVAGFPGIGDYSPVLTHAVVRAVGTAEQTPPWPIKAEDVVVREVDFDNVSFDNQLVQVEGRVIQSRSEGTQRVLMLRDGDRVFGARENLPPGSSHPGVPEGSTVRLTGICSITTDADRKPTGFSLLLRSPRDIVLLKKAPWWNPVNAATLFLTLGLFTTLVAAWVIVLRKQVERQTRMVRESESRYRHLAEHDVLTGLLNRSTLEERLAVALYNAQRTHLSTAVFTIDIDLFKPINDTHGHLVGDEILKAVAHRLSSAVRKADTVARTGGEEFTIVAASLTPGDGPERIGMAILQAFRQPVRLTDQEIAVTVSIGCALFPGDATKGDELRKRSDQALYEAKRTGRNRIVFASQLVTHERRGAPPPHLLPATC